MSHAVSIDFDGVINSYKSRFIRDDIIPDEPVPGAKEFITALKEKGFKIYIHTTRAVSFDGHMAVRRWLKAYKIPFDSITAVKVPSLVYLDDRGVCFKGVFNEDLLNHIINFKSWVEN